MLWLAVNNDEVETNTVLEIGGKSLQIAFEIDRASFHASALPAENLFMLYAGKQMYAISIYYY
jgi:hypothetical protein